jgi:hypothetical protein
MILTDEEIKRRSLEAYHASCFAQGARWARDRMVEQPETDCGCKNTITTVRDASACAQHGSVVPENKS